MRGSDDSIILKITDTRGRHATICILPSAVGTQFPGSIQNEDKVLKDRFVEGLVSHTVKTGLRKEVRKNVTISFRNLNEDALHQNADIAAEPVDGVVDTG